jgi:tRNA threonylcarbamoyladenosine biosynthesis protein TsaB
VVAVSRLALVAAAARARGGEVCAVLDAGRGEFYCGRYLGAECVAESLVGLEEAVALAGRAETAVACEASVAAAFAGAPVRVALAVVGEPTAADALPLAQERLRRGLFDDPMTLDANYLRRTDAEIFAKPAGVVRS